MSQRHLAACPHSHKRPAYISFSIKLTYTHTHTLYQTDCWPLITSHVLIGKSVKEIRTVRVAQCGSDTSERETAGANLVDPHMLLSKGHLTVNLPVEVARLFLHSLSIRPPSHVSHQNNVLSFISSKLFSFIRVMH